MSVKIRKFKRLFEDDANNPQATTQQPAATDATTTPANNQAPAPAAPAQNPAPAQPDANAQQQPAQSQQPQQQQDNQPNETQQAVTEILKSMENTYWCIANNVPDMIKEKLPDFKPENEQAKPIIGLWDAFKKDPNENTFKAFLEGFKNFGAPVQTDNSTQPAAPAQNQVPQNNVSASIQYNFTTALHENLKIANYQKKLNNLKNYF